MASVMAKVFSFRCLLSYIFFFISQLYPFSGRTHIACIFHGKNKTEEKSKKKTKQVTFEPLFSCKWQPEPTGDGQEKDRGLDSWTSFGHNPRRLLSAAVWLSLAATLKLQLFAIAWLRWHFSFYVFSLPTFPF